MAPRMYRFNIDLSAPDSGQFTKYRVQTARHHEESLEHLHARVLAFTHRYVEGIAFSEGLWQPEQPAIWRRDVVGEIIEWIEVGEVRAEKLRKALRHNPAARFSAYFYDHLQIEHFLHSMKGERPDLIDKISWYRIDPRLLQTSAEADKIDSRWDLTIVHTSVYATFDDRYVEGLIEEIDPRR